MQSRKSNQKSSHILEIRDRIQDFQNILFPHFMTLPVQAIFVYKPRSKLFYKIFYENIFIKPKLVLLKSVLEHRRKNPIKVRFLSKRIHSIG